ncbi:MAG TPA: SDR family oxidoreductase [Cyclobacteriaceae bacterium]|jgi:short-subunit dehydrogenase
MKDKVVIITGGSSGIGKALAEIFGSKGSKIVITGRNSDALSKVVFELEKKGIEILGVHSDVSKWEDNVAMVDQTLTRFEQIDVLINNAGINMRALFSDVDLEVIKKVMDINFYGTIYATKACLPHILKNKGSILGISSIAGYRGLPGKTAYSTSKFAMQGFLEVLRTELLYTGVNVMTVCPGFTASNIRKATLNKEGKLQGESPRNEDKMMTAEECAKRIYKAAVNRRKIVIMTRQGKLAVFMNKWFPVWMDKKVYDLFADEPGSPLSQN